ncbi:MAG: hypothetical protein LBL03_00630 [Endomicrobium sp.]|jgi:hypothetical protein|nr:hypothetical protein [Endomicrobium sp.]
MGFVSSNEIMIFLKKKYGLNDTFFVIMNVWEKETCCYNIDICGYKNGIIFAKTNSSVIKCEFVFCKKSIINKLNQYIGTNLIKDIYVYIK